MTRDMRLALFGKELARLLQSGREHDYVVFRDVADPDHYVQYLRHDGALYGEVGSLEWAGADRKLRKKAETALACLGFSGGGHRRNYSRDHLPNDARRLAGLTELLFGAAYGPIECLTVLVMTRASQEAAWPAPRIELDA